MTSKTWLTNVKSMINMWIKDPIRRSVEHSMGGDRDMKQDATGTHLSEIMKFRPYHNQYWTILIISWTVDTNYVEQSTCFSNCTTQSFLHEASTRTCMALSLRSMLRVFAQTLWPAIQTCMIIIYWYESRSYSHQLNQMTYIERGKKHTPQVCVH